MLASAPAGQDASVIQFACDGPECDASLFPDRADDGSEVRGKGIVSPLHGVTKRLPALPCPPGGTEDHAGARPEETVARPDRRGRGLQDRPIVTLPDECLETGRGLRPQRGHVCLGHSIHQHHDVHGPADAEHPFLLRPVRARSNGRADP